MKRQLPKVLLSSFRSSKRRPQLSSPKKNNNIPTSATCATSMFYDGDEEEGDEGMEVDMEAEQYLQHNKNSNTLFNRHAHHRRSLQLQNHQNGGNNRIFVPHFFHRHRQQPQQASLNRPLSLDHPPHHPDDNDEYEEADDALHHHGCACTPSGPSPSGSGGGGFVRSASMENGANKTHHPEVPVKVAYVLEELLSTERSYVRELGEIVTHYVQPFESLDLSGGTRIPSALRGQADLLFGNIRELLDFHQTILLPALQQHVHSVHGVCVVLCTQRTRLLALYRAYCRNKPASEALRAEHAVDQCKLFAECQRRAGHLLPLSAYLLKPIQRITKYQLLLKELVRHYPAPAQQDTRACSPAVMLQSALACMLDLLAQINADMEQLHILGYPGDLRLLGALRLRTECEVYSFKRAKSTTATSNGSSRQELLSDRNRRSASKGKHQKRHLFLFDGGVLFCKKRAQLAQQHQSPPQLQCMPPTSEYYEHKLCIPMHSLGFADRHAEEERFELWDVHESTCYAVRTIEERAHAKWVQRLTRLIVLHQQQKMGEGLPLDSPQLFHNNNKAARPQSWTTTSSSEDGMPSIGGVAAGNSEHRNRNNASGLSSSRSSTTSSSSSSSSAALEDKCPDIGGGIMSASCPPATQAELPSDASAELRSRSQPPLIADQ